VDVDVGSFTRWLRHRVGKVALSIYAMSASVTQLALLCDNVTLYGVERMPTAMLGLAQAKMGERRMKVSGK
jgi:hypothetical protein